jgi:hypothetical protein
MIVERRNGRASVEGRPVGHLKRDVLIVVKNGDIRRIIDRTHGALFPAGESNYLRIRVHAEHGMNTITPSSRSCRVDC